MMMWGAPDKISQILKNTDLHISASSKMAFEIFRTMGFGFFEVEKMAKYA